MSHIRTKKEGKLLFRCGVEDASFSSSTTSNAANADATTIVRELIQNSLDAAKEINREQAIIRFEIEEIDQSFLPGFDDLLDAFPHALDSQTKLSKGKLPDIQAQIASVFKKNLAYDKVYLFSVSDNGVGLTEDTMKALLGDGRSAKASSGGGAHGYGHLTVLPSSNLRLVYYGGISQNGARVGSGHCILAPFQDQEKVNHTKDGYLVEALEDDLFEPYKFLLNENVPELISNKIDTVHESWGSGTVVLVPSFNFFKGTPNDLWSSIEKAASTNFFASFAQNEIIIEFDDGVTPHRIDAHNIENTLEKYAGETNARSFIAGSKALECFRVIKSGHQIEFKTDVGNVNGKLLRFERGKSTRIDLCRNGMWIVHNNSPGKQLPRLQSSAFSDYQPFHLVLMLKASDGELHDLIRKSEPPIHDQVDLKQLTDDDRKTLQRAFSEIQEQIKQNLEKIDAKSVAMDGILSLPVGGSGSGGKHGTYAGEWQPFERSPKISAGTKLVEHGEDSSQGQKKNKRKGNGSGAGIKTTKKKGNTAPFRAIPVPINSRKYEVEIHPLEDIEAGEIRFMIDQNMDETCRIMNGEPLVRLENIKLNKASISQSQTNKNSDGDVISLLVPNIQKGNKFSLEFDFVPPDDLILAKDKFIGLKVEIIKRKDRQSGEKS